MIPNYSVPFLRTKTRQVALLIEELEKKNSDLRLALKTLPYLTRGDLADLTSQLRNNTKKLDLMHELIRLWNEYRSYPTDEALLQLRSHIALHGQTILAFRSPSGDT